MLPGLLFETPYCGPKLLLTLYYTPTLLIPMQDFSTPSLEGVLARENLEEGVPAVAAADDNDQLEQYQIVERRQWEQKYVYSIFVYTLITTVCAWLYLDPLSLYGNTLHTHITTLHFSTPLAPTRISFSMKTM